MFEYRAVWNVQGGGIGYSVFHVREAAGQDAATQAPIFAANLRSGLNTIASRLPDDVILTFESEARVLDVTTGNLTTVVPVTPPAQITGGSTGVYSAPAGARVDLITGAIVAGRRLRGRTYIVPLSGDSFSNVGQVSAAARTALDAAFNSFRNVVGGYSLGVWSRTHGIIADVSGVATASESAILRSRRE